VDIEEIKYIIGIDLGTTNSALSYVDFQDPKQKDRKISLFPIAQLTAAGEVSRMQVLPSFCYIPGKYDIDPSSIRLPWSGNRVVSSFVGSFARDHGSKVPARLVSSAKSWLCHAHADRRAKILPWGSGGDVEKISPVQATAAYLDHLKSAWNNTRDDEEQYLENQLLVITVPASFDEVARDLTLEAAKSAGLNEVVLLEEPLAAFYCWLSEHEKDWQDYISPGELVLVCDVGGGTTDLTLITLQQSHGSPRFERIAVGDHLILGGDNIDLALARHVEQQFGTKGNLTGDRWKTLCHLCRQAKENILSHGTESEIITMVGEGSRLIGGTLRAEITRQTLENIVLEGFFPLVEKSVPAPETGRRGISEFGLPYASDPAITRHIGLFLEQHKDDIYRFTGRSQPFPDLVLFNGGSLKAKIVQDRIIDAVSYWFKDGSEKTEPKVLENPDLDVAVALGASYYGLVRTGKGVRVGSGSPRSYYLGITHADPNGSGTQQAVCVVERGLDEGSKIALEEHKFEVLANQPVSFDLFSSSFRSGDRSGDIIDIDESLTRLPPIQTVIQFGKKGVQTTIPIKVEAEYTEAGVLELWCRSTATDHRWQLRFQLRQMPAQGLVAETGVFDAGLEQEVISAVEEAFLPQGPGGRLAGIVKTISNLISCSRDDWPLTLIRKIADVLLDNMDARKYSPEHEIRWLNLTGFCLRPGFGDGLDEQRINRLWKIYKKGVIFKKNQQVSAEWWILWRRVAGGLSPGRQRQFAQDIRPLLMPRKGARTKLSQQQRMEIWMALANMERLGVREKSEWGDCLVSEMNPKKSKPQHFWSLSRIGARQLLYGPVDRVVGPEKAGSWIGFLLDSQWKEPKAAGAALVQMARKTGDRARDIDDQLIERVSKWLEANDMKNQTRILKTAAPLKEPDESAIFGEPLPAGLILRP
jgi:molecular chaperone DnaK (HSP70)